MHIVIGKILFVLLDDGLMIIFLNLFTRTLAIIQQCRYSLFNSKGNFTVLKTRLIISE